MSNTWNTPATRRFATMFVVLIVTGLAAVFSISHAVTGTALSGPIASYLTDRSKRVQDIHMTDWSGVVIPGRLCGSQSDIHLKNGEALNVPSTFDGPTPDYPQDVLAGTRDVTYGDLTGDGRDEAAMPVSCTNHDSTVSGRTAGGLVVFTLENAGPLKAVAIITGQKRLPEELPTYVKCLRIIRGQIVVEETWYGPGDYACCATGKAISDWQYSNNQLRLVGTNVVRLPDDHWIG